MTPRHLLRIARWEVGRTASEVDRRTVVVLLVLVGGLAVVGPALADAGSGPSRGIYRVAGTDGGPYAAVVADATELRAVDAGPGAVRARRADVRVVGDPATGETELVVADSQKGRAALDALRSAVSRYNDRLMAREDDRAAAFPVRVTVDYRDRTVSQVGPTATPGTGDGDGDGRSTQTTAAPSTGQDGDWGFLGGLLDGSPLGGLRATGQSLFGAPQTGTPGDIQPPFPMQALLVAFAFVVPLNPVAQAFGSSVIGERIDRRGEPLLVSPASRGDIVLGKTLPYAAASVLLAALVALLMGAGPVSLIAVLPVVAVFLGATLVAGLFARSFSELTFLTMTVSVVVTAYVFVPAVFTDVHPVASISPLSMVVRDLTGTAVRPATFAFATVPMSLVAVTLFGLGVSVYREEDLFTQRPPPAKALDAVAAHLTRRRVPLWAALTLPFVFVAELFAVAVLFVLPASVGLPVLLAAVALIEEVAKSLPVLAALRRGIVDSARGPALLAGALAGFGFAVGEKVFAVAQVVGLPELRLGRAAFAPVDAGDPLLLVGLLLAPVALHVGTAVLSAAGARRSLRAYGVALTGAVLVHLAYNATVVSLVV
ncbi:MAG: PrsW family intramembrane metalloprotease [Halobacteriaceae archaeon]